MLEKDGHLRSKVQRSQGKHNSIMTCYALLCGLHLGEAPFNYSKDNYLTAGGPGFERDVRGLGRHLERAALQWSAGSC